MDGFNEYGTIQLSTRQQERVESLLNESDGLRLFLADAVEPFSGESLTASAIVEKYAGYCSEQGWNMTIRRTEEQLPELMMELFHINRSHNIPSGDSHVRGYRGVRLKQTGEEAENDGDREDPDSTHDLL